MDVIQRAGARRPALAVASIAVATFLVTFDGAAVEMALPAMHLRLHRSIDDIQWIMTAYLLVGTAVLLPAGRAGDVVGQTRPWMRGVVLFVLASLVAAVAPGFWVLLAARIVQGFASALVAANAPPLIVEAVPRAWRGRALAGGNIAIAAGLVAGPSLGGLLTSTASWRAIFLVAVPVGTAAWFLGRRTLPPLPVQGRLSLGELRAVDAALSGLGIAGLLVTATLGAHRGWTGLGVVLPGAAGAVLLGVFGVREARAARPLIDRDLLRRRTVLSALATTFCAFAAVFTLTFAMPFFLVLGQGRALASAGVLVGGVPLGLVVAAPLGGWLYDRSGSRAACTGGLLILAAGLWALSSARPDTGSLTLLAGLFLAGVGLGLFEAPNDAATLGSVPELRLSIATATLGTLRQLGMTVGVAIAATLFTRHAHGLTATSLAAPVLGVDARAVTAGLHDSLLVGAAIGLAGAVAAAVRAPRA